MFTDILYCVNFSPFTVHVLFFSVGGSQPIVFSYVSEFFSEKQRGPVIVILASCWQPGIIFTGRWWSESKIGLTFCIFILALLAWILLGIKGPDQSVSFYIGSLHFVNWRLFLIICTIPALISAVSLLFMPETPAYLLHVGCIVLYTCIQLVPLKSLSRRDD